MQIRWKAGWRAAPSSEAPTVDEQDTLAAAVAVAVSQLADGPQPP